MAPVMYAQAEVAVSDIDDHASDRPSGPITKNATAATAAPTAARTAMYGVNGKRAVIDAARTASRPVRTAVRVLLTNGPTAANWVIAVLAPMVAMPNETIAGPMRPTP